MKNEWLRVGVITSTHGLNGDVKVFPTTDDPQRFLYIEEAAVGSETEHRMLRPDHIRFFKQFVIVHFSGLNRIEDVLPLVRAELWVDREHAAALEKDEYYIADLLGMEAVSDEGEVLGRIEDVIQTGANDVYVIRDGGKELLVPAIRQCIRQVDLEGNRMIIHLLEGLR